MMFVVHFMGSKRSNANSSVGSTPSPPVVYYMDDVGFFASYFIIFIFPNNLKAEANA